MSGATNTQISDKSPSIAAIVCGYDPKRYQQLKEAIDSLLHQSHSLDEIIVVISGSPTLKEKFNKEYADHKNVRLVFSEQSLGATQARNKGIQNATSEILAFTDDDAIADSNWAASLIDTYRKTNAVAVGGKVLPMWLTSKPDHLPEELYWLVGATHESFMPDNMVELRNTFGPNMSFSRKVFEEIGLFNENLGFAKRGTSYIQGEEPEFGLRMVNKLGKGMVYNPQAIIYHTIPPHKLKYSILFKRSFYQGYSKSLIQKHIDSSNILGPEKTYLKEMVGTYIPLRIKGLFHRNEKTSQAKKLFVLLVSLACVGTGFAYGHITHFYKR